MIRLSRSRRCRKRNKQTVIGLQIALIIYLLIGLGSQLNQNTNASFHDVERSSFSMKAGTKFKDVNDKQWDGSDLTFKKQTSTKGKIPESLPLFAEVNNHGDQMTTSKWKWELHKVESSSKPLKDGKVIDKGTVSKEIHDGVYRIESTRELSEGKYAFKLIKPKGHPDFKGKKSYIWSKVIELKESKEKESSKETRDSKEEKKETTKTKQD
ncbi:amyloid fiber anchoring/assembly protein TapA [Bacillus changyiensis]|uniref:amyloid fiber anchoring/assembly protein TapA n=1 Tax=Bacillus changyiensis TaxID=3004103 RepID=UPI0022DFAD7B|nr:amyloid fiber anchoring/assembly protein TapA [Bacillus changyiensis]MDA1474861.1 amyloid fiber anchoring/assembly protein TapA [Bacillus changyiensis]